MSNKGDAAEGHVRRLRFGEAEILGGIGVAWTRQEYVRKWVEAHWGGAGVQGAGVRSEEGENKVVRSKEVRNKGVESKIVQSTGVRDGKVQNEKVCNKLVQNEKVCNKLIQDEKVQNKEVQNKLIQNEKVQSKKVQNKLVQSTEVQNKKVYNKLIQNTLVQSIEVENKKVQNEEVCNKEKQSREAINTKACNNLTGTHSEDEYIDNTQAECAPARVPPRVRGLNCVNTRENMVVARSRETCSLAVSRVGRDYKYQRAKENVPLLIGHSGCTNKPQEDSKGEKCIGALSPACKRSQAKRPNPDGSPVLSRGSCCYKQKHKRAKEERRESPGLLRSRSHISVRLEDSNKEEFNKQDSNEQDSKKMAARMDSNCSQKSADSDATHFSTAERGISVDSSEDLVKISEATSASVSGLRNESEFSISTATSPPRQNSNSLVEFKLLDSAKKRKKPKRGSLTEKLQSLVNNQASFVRIWRHQRKQSKDNTSPRAIALRVTAQGVHFTRQFFRGVVVSDPFDLLPSRTKDCGERESPSNVGRSITLMTVPEVIGSLEIKGRCLLQVAAPWDVLDDDDLVIVAAYVNAVAEEGINGGCVMFNRRETCKTNSVVDKEFNGGCTTFNRRETCTTNSVADKKINGGCITFNGPPGSCTSSVVDNEINGGCIKFTRPGSCKTNSAAGKQFNCDCIKFNRPLPSCKSAKEKPDVMEQLFRSI